MVSYSGINCLNITDKTITVLATPTIRFDPIQEVCSNAPAFQITQAGITNTLPGAGVFSGPGVSPTGLFSPSVAGAGNHILRYTYTGSNGCSNYREQTMSVNPTPFANAGPDKFVLEGGVVQLTPALNTGFPVTYLWTPPAGLNNPTIADPLASPTDDITYTLTVTSAKGCTTSDQVFVKVLKKPEIPNIFSPNGDGIHDKWVINFLETYPGCTVEIFNRYGQRIYYSIGYTNPWDGTVNGKPVPVGTYYYIVDPKNGRQRMSGYVDVIR
jgi:gliding motility-associated-like protein